jgi:hypothetical protein
MRMSAMKRTIFSDLTNRGYQYRITLFPVFDIPNKPVIIPKENGERPQTNEEREML